MVRWSGAVITAVDLAAAGRRLRPPADMRGRRWMTHHRDPHAARRSWPGLCRADPADPRLTSRS
jgi:hypothetical protein